MMYSVIFNNANGRVTLVCDKSGERTFTGFDSVTSMTRWMNENDIEVPLKRCYHGYEAWKAAR